VAEPGSFIWFGIDNFPAKERKRKQKILAALLMIPSTFTALANIY